MIIFLVVLALMFSQGICAQQRQAANTETGQSHVAQEHSSRSQGGMANAGPREARFDSQHRPITDGGFVRTGPVIFQDVASAA